MYKSIKIIYDSVLDAKLIELVKNENVEKYIKVPKVEGCWSKEKRHFDTHIWPGTDEIMMILLEEEKAKKLVEKLRKFKENLTVDVPINILVTPVDEII